MFEWKLPYVSRLMGEQILSGTPSLALRLCAPSPNGTEAGLYRIERQSFQVLETVHVEMIFCPNGAIDPQIVNAISSEVQRMWLASSRPAKKQATAESGINKFRLYQPEDQ